MAGFFSLLKRKKEKNFLVLDIGSEAVKVALFKKKGGKNVVSACSLVYFDKYGVFSSRDFQRDLLERTISRALYDLTKEKKPAEKIIIGLPPDILKTRMFFSSLPREKPREIITDKEEKNIFQNILQDAAKNISQTHNEETGILAKDLHFLKLKILEIKIDGYAVSALRGYEGQRLEFKVAAIFLPGQYLKEIETIIEELGFKKRDFIHNSEGLDLFLNEMPNGLFLDIGGEATQIFSAKAGRIEKTAEFFSGGKTFSRVFSERLGLNELEARILKERYSQKELSQESLFRIKEMLRFPSQSWSKGLKNELAKMYGNDLLPGNIYLFGGGSLLPEIAEILSGKNWDDVSFSERLRLKIIYPEELLKMKTGFNLPEMEFEDKIKDKFNEPQFTASLMLYYAQTQKTN